MHPPKHNAKLNAAKTGTKTTLSVTTIPVEAPSRRPRRIPHTSPDSPAPMNAQATGASFEPAAAVAKVSTAGSSNASVNHSQ